jgi:sentrin-specific protease 1
VTYPQVASLGCCFIPALQAAQSSAVWAELVCKKTALTLDFPNLDYIFIPVNHSNTHWALISVSIEEKIIRYYDSLKWNDRGIMKLVQDHLTSISLNPDKEEWRTEICSELPIQTNTFDCGVFLCQYAYCIASGKSFNYLTENTRNLRQLMHNEFLEGKVREGNSTEEKPLDKGKSESPWKMNAWKEKVFLFLMKFLLQQFWKQIATVLLIKERRIYPTLMCLPRRLRRS